MSSEASSLVTAFKYLGSSSPEMVTLCVRASCTWSTRTCGSGAMCWASMRRSNRGCSGPAPVSPLAASLHPTSTTLPTSPRSRALRLLPTVCASQVRLLLPDPTDPLPPKSTPRYGDGTVRVTVEENVLFPNIPEANLEALQKVPQAHCPCLAPVLIV